MKASYAWEEMDAIEGTCEDCNEKKVLVCKVLDPLNFEEMWLCQQCFDIRVGEV